MKLKELQDKLLRIAKEMRDMHAKAEKEDRGFSADEDQAWARLLADYEDVEKRIEASQRVTRLEAPTDERIPDTGESRAAVGDIEARGTPEYRAAYMTFLRGEDLSVEERSLLRKHQAEMEIRAQGTATGAAGGFTIPTGFAGFITETMKDFSGLYGAANPAGNGGPTLLRTASGNTIPFPTNNDTANVGAILTENTQVSEGDTVFGSRNLSAFMYTSLLVRVSLQLLQDEAVNLEQYLGNILGKRIGRALGPHLAIGTGSGQPTGIATAATDGGIDISTAAGITYQDLVDFEHALDPAYRRRGAKWVFNDTTLKAIKSLKDSQNRPLWLPQSLGSLADQLAGPTLLGYGYIVDQGMQNVGTGNRPIVFGDLSEYYVREVEGVNMFRFAERYMDFLQIGFMAYARYDGNLIDTAAVVTDIGVI